MQLSKFAVLLLAGLLCASVGHSQAEQPIVSDITVQCAVISLPKDQALKFLVQNRLDSEAGKGLDALLALVEQKQAVSAVNAAITSRSGQKATNESGTTKLEVEPVQSPSGGMIDTNLQFNYDGKVINTAIMVKNGDVKFLGAFDSAKPAENITYLMFVRTSAPRAGE